MSRESKERSRKTEKKVRKAPRDLARTLDPAVLARARKIAAAYTIVLEPHDRLGFLGSSVEIPTVFTHGKTEGECIKITREGLAIAVAVILEAGEVPPAAASERKRDQQLNIRLTGEERLLLEGASRRQGFRGVSDFVRNAALAQTRKIA